MSKIRDRFMKRIGKYVWDDTDEWHRPTLSPIDIGEDILNLRIRHEGKTYSLAIVDKKAELPSPPALDVSNITTVKQLEYQEWDKYLKAYKQAQQDMLKQGWVKEIKDS